MINPSLSPPNLIASSENPDLAGTVYDPHWNFTPFRTSDSYQDASKTEASGTYQSLQDGTCHDGSPTQDPHAAHSGHEDLVSYNALDDRLRLRGNVWGEAWGKVNLNEPIVLSNKAGIQNVYEGTVGILSEFRLESDVQIPWLKGVPFFENILAGKTRFDHVGAHATFDNARNGVQFDLVGNITHTWPDIPLATPSPDQVTPALAFSVYSTGHRHIDDRDIFLPQGHGSLGIIAYERWSGVFGQFDGEHVDDLPWQSAMSARIGWMMPLDRVYHAIGWESLRSALGGGPHDHGSTTTALPNSSDDLWERSKIAFYYQTKNFDDPMHPDFNSLQNEFANFNAANVKAREQSIGIFLEHRFNAEPAESPVARAIFADSRVLVGLEYKSLRITGENDHIADHSLNWLAPSMIYEKSIATGAHSMLNVRLYVTRDRFAGEEEDESFHMKPVTTEGFRISISSFF